MSKYIVHNGELYHWGIKGMKWGVRRFQNNDGTLTPAGKKRYSDDYNTNHTEKSYKELSNEELKSRNARYENEQKYKKFTGEKDDDEIAEDIIDNASKAPGKAMNILNSIQRIRSAGKPGPDYSHLSDQELRNRINRLDMERRYSELTREKESKGSVYAREFINIAGDVIAVTGSVIAIASGVKALRKK